MTNLAHLGSCQAILLAICACDACFLAVCYGCLADHTDLLIAHDRRGPGGIEHSNWSPGQPQHLEEVKLLFIELMVITAGALLEFGHPQSTIYICPFCASREGKGREEGRKCAMPGTARIGLEGMRQDLT